jgi:mono/diheme cytochrome c family protein
MFPLLLLASMSSVFANEAASGSKIEFNRDIRPVLAAKCSACHGPDEDKREAGLRLDVRAEAVKEAIIPGKPDESEFWKRLTSADPDDVMPPPSSPKQLTKAERDLFRRWISQGAEYQEHWSFVPIRRTAPPAVQARHPIDAFIRQNSPNTASSLLPRLIQSR